MTMIDEAEKVKRLLDEAEWLTDFDNPDYCTNLRAQIALMQGGMAHKLVYLLDKLAILDTQADVFEAFADNVLKKSVARQNSYDWLKEFIREMMTTAGIAKVEGDYMTATFAARGHAKKFNIHKNQPYQVPDKEMVLAEMLEEYANVRTKQSVAQDLLDRAKADAAHYDLQESVLRLNIQLRMEAEGIKKAIGGGFSVSWSDGKESIKVLNINAIPAEYIAVIPEEKKPALKLIAKARKEGVDFGDAIEIVKTPFISIR